MDATITNRYQSLYASVVVSPVSPLRPQQKAKVDHSSTQPLEYKARTSTPSLSSTAVTPSRAVPSHTEVAAAACGLLPKSRPPFGDEAMVATEIAALSSPSSSPSSAPSSANDSASHAATASIARRRTAGAGSTKHTTCNIDTTNTTSFSPLFLLSSSSSPAPSSADTDSTSRAPATHYFAVGTTLKYTSGEGISGRSLRGELGDRSTAQYTDAVNTNAVDGASLDRHRYVFKSKSDNGPSTAVSNHSAASPSYFYLSSSVVAEERAHSSRIPASYIGYANRTTNHRAMATGISGAEKLLPRETCSASSALSPQQPSILGKASSKTAPTSAAFSATGPTSSSGTSSSSGLDAKQLIADGVQQQRPINTSSPSSSTVSLRVVPPSATAFASTSSHQSGHGLIMSPKRPTASFSTAMTVTATDLSHTAAVGAGSKETSAARPTAASYGPTSRFAPSASLFDAARISAPTRTYAELFPHSTSNPTPPSICADYARPPSSLLSSNAASSGSTLPNNSSVNTRSLNAAMENMYASPGDRDVAVRARSPPSRMTPSRMLIVNSPLRK